MISCVSGLIPGLLVMAWDKTTTLAKKPQGLDQVCVHIQRLEVGWQAPHVLQTDITLYCG